MRRTAWVLAVATAVGAAAFGDEPAGGTGPVVHEWGVLDIPASAADAVPFDLPAFVGRPRVVPRDEPRMARAPVIYVYPSFAPSDCSVQVTFATGGACAWWPLPQATMLAPAPRRPAPAEVEGRRRRMSPEAGGEPLVARSLSWRLRFGEEVDRKVDLRDAPPGSGAPPEPPAVPEGHWFSFARNVDAPFFESISVGDGESVRSQRENFLFYEGSIEYANPIVVEGTSAEPRIRNAGDHSLLDVAWIEVAGGGVRVRRVGDLGAGAAAPVPAAGDPVAPEAAHGDLVSSLVAAGLYEKEAVAMARTWRPALFEREGVRAIARWPQEVYDRHFPLTVGPIPARETVRVMLLHRGGVRAVDPADLDLWIGRLGSDSFAEREEATRALEAIGPSAADRLRAARDASTDPEASARLDAVLERIASALPVVR